MRTINAQNLIKGPNTNWKYVLIIATLAFLVGGGILGYQYWWLPKQEVEMPEIEIPEKEKREEVEEMPEPTEDPYSFLKDKITAYPWDPIYRRKIYEERFIFDDESLKKTILRHIVEDLQLFRYLTKEEIDLVDNIKVGILKIDLNEDNVPEYIITESSIEMHKEEAPAVLAPCGTGGCSIYIFGFIEGKWRLISDPDMFGFWRGPLKDRRTAGYHNLVIYHRLGAGAGIYKEYAWSGERYELIKTTEVDYTVDPPILPPDEYKIFEKRGSSLKPFNFLFLCNVEHCTLCGRFSLLINLDNLLIFC